VLQIRYSLNDIERLAGGVELLGGTNLEVSGISTLSEAAPGDLTFLGNKKYKSEVADTKASVVLIPKDYEGKPSHNQAYVIVDNPSLSLALICREIECRLWPKPDPSIDKSAFIAANAKIGNGVFIGAGCVIDEGAVIGDSSVIQAQSYVGKGAIIGEQSWLMPRASVLDYCKIGKRAKLSTGVVVGSDGFGYETIKGIHNKVPQVGHVDVGDDVDIGANTTIDRARFGKTLIGSGTKIDNLVQIGHNVKIGKNCIIVAQAGISGSTVIEDNVVIAGQAGIAGHLRIGKGSQLSAQCGVNHDLEAGSFVRGTPAFPFMMANRIEILKRRLPDLFKRVEKIEEVLQHVTEPAPKSDQ
jgi:UDP-3-O-[3-hydroxymyristoyl] glucosamine N-acyltransferase